MLIRLAFGNVVSHRGGYVPFLTVTAVVVALFYAFGTIDGQTSFIQGGADLPMRYDLLVDYVTLALSCAVGVIDLLLVSSSAVFYRREQAMLLVMGLERWRLMAVGVLEQAFVVTLGLVAGIPLGILLSQVLVFVTAAILSGTVEGYHFFLSAASFWGTLRCGLVIFLLSSVSSALLAWQASPRNLSNPASRAPVRSRPALSAAVLALGFVSTTVGALMLGQVDLRRVIATGDGAWQPVASLVLLALGTYGVIQGTAGLSAAMPFLHREGGPARVSVYSHVQANDFMRRNPGTVTFATLFLTIALCTLVNSLGSVGSLGQSFAEYVTADATIDVTAPFGSTPDLLASAERAGADLAGTARVVQVSCYDARDVAEAWGLGPDGLSLDSLVARSGTGRSESPLSAESGDRQPILMSESDYNALRSLHGEAPCDLAGSHYLITTDFGAPRRAFLSGLLSSGVTLDAGGRELSPLTGWVATGPSASFQNATYPTNPATIVVPDELLASLRPRHVHIDLMYLDGTRPQEGDALAYEIATAVLRETTPVSMTTNTATGVTYRMRSDAAALSYVSVYVAMVLLLTCCALLSARAVEHVCASAGDYRIFIDLGAERSQVRHSATMRTIAMFGGPALFAVYTVLVALSQSAQETAYGIPLSAAGVSTAFLVFWFAVGTFGLGSRATADRILRDRFYRRDFSS